MNSNSITIIITNHTPNFNNMDNTNNILKIMQAAVHENLDMSTVEQKLKLKQLLMLPSSATGDGKGKVQLHTVGEKWPRDIFPSLRVCFDVLSMSFQFLNGMYVNTYIL